MNRISALLILIFLNLSPLSAQDYLIPASDGIFWGYIDQDGQWVIPARFEEALPYVNGMGCVKITVSP